MPPREAPNGSQSPEHSEQKPAASHVRSLRMGYTGWIGGSERADSRDWGKRAKLVVKLGKDIELYGECGKNGMSGKLAWFKRGGILGKSLVVPQTFDAQGSTRG